MTRIDALHDALDHAALSAFITSGGDDQDVAEEALLDAELSVFGAYEPDSDVSRALGVIFGEIRQAAEGAS